MGKKDQTGEGAPLIKGYLPIRILLPSLSTFPSQTQTQTRETFLYVRPNKTTRTTHTHEEDSSGRTLFVCNVPVIPQTHAYGRIPAKVFLHDLFGQVGEVEEVVVVNHPRHFTHCINANNNNNNDENDEKNPVQPFRQLIQNQTHSKSSKQQEEEEGGGSFAHVTFLSMQECKKAFQKLKHLMTTTAASTTTTTTTKKKSKKAAGFPGVVYSIQQLHHLSSPQQQHQQPQQPPPTTTITSPVETLAQQEIQHAHPSREALLQLCNRVMIHFESREAAHHSLVASSKAGVMDKDGFITVRYGHKGAMVGNAELQQQHTHEKVHDEEGDADGFITPSNSNSNTFQKGAHKRISTKRKSRRHNHNAKKTKLGSSELNDFYRFQFKEQKKSHLRELRERFEHDLEEVQKRKEAKRYRAFG